MRPSPRTLTAFIAIALPLAAQQGSIAYRNFRHSPPGQYRQELQGFMDGKPMGAPITQTVCTDPVNPARVAAARNMANQAATMQSCTMHLLRDEPTLAESEQICNPGPAQQTIRTTLQSIDDTTLKSTVVSTLGPRKTTMISTVHYLGACTEAQKEEIAHAPAIPTTPSLTAEQCAEFASHKREMTDAIKGCDDAPEDQRPTCVATMKAAAGRLDKILASCPR